MMLSFLQAIVNYEQAADYYRGEESNSSANKCLLKVAQYQAQLEHYDKAIEIYEQVSVNQKMVDCLIFLWWRWGSSACPV